MRIRTTASELQHLLRDGKIEAAIALCDKNRALPVIGGYYAFWLQRLTTKGRAITSDVNETRAIETSSLSEAILRNISRYKYVLGAYDEQIADPESSKAELIASLPFKSEIYLPTSKIEVQKQIQGLRRVRDLLNDHNLAVTRARFEGLKAAIQATGKRRIFVVGNGPSLKKTDLSLLKDEISIGFNGIFLHDTFRPTIYIVEDHLVAEDRVGEILSYDCPVKLFPSYLAYCIEPQDNTIYLNHRPRLSYPVDTDFSSDAGRITYTGGTVTYTGLQVAASLGFEEIILIGVDASYTVNNVKRSDSYGVGVLTSISDDPNHFDPTYFGKGYRWHDPNVHVMLQAYRKARDWGRANGVRFINATVGGQLEAFPRANFYSLFPADKVYPRIAILDYTSVERVCATGILKRNLLEDWPRASLLHIHSDDRRKLSAFQASKNDQYVEGVDGESVWPAFRSLLQYSPDALYLRPTLDSVPMTVLQAVAAATLNKPWLIHYMDDWLEKAKQMLAPDVAHAYEELMGWMFTRADIVLSICPKMSDYLRERFRLCPERVHAIHNFFKGRKNQRRREQRGQDKKVIRYFGGLEPDMGLATLVKVAQQVDAFNASRPFMQVALEIHTSKHYISKHASAFSNLKAVTFHVQSDSYDEYLERLESSDLNLICYNFDPVSVSYVRYSFANKLPELLNANVPFLAIGAPEIATIGYLQQANYPLVLESPDFDISNVLQHLFEPNGSLVDEMHSAIAVLKEEFTEEKNKYRLYELFRSVVQKRRSDGVSRDDLYSLVDNLRVICDSFSESFKNLQDVDLLLKLPLLSSEMLKEVFDKVRVHGLTWSVGDEFSNLKRQVKSKEDIATGSEDLKTRSLAFLICGFGISRYEPLNGHIRAWLRTHS